MAYANAPGVKRYLEIINDNSQEFMVDAIWNGVLNYYFPPTEPWVVAPKPGRNEQLPDYVVIKILTNPDKELDIMVLENKRPDETQSHDDIAFTQLTEYCFECCEISSLQKMYGAVSIGTHVKFYVYDKNGRHPHRGDRGAPATLVVPDRYRNPVGGVYDLRVNNHEIEYLLQYIKANPFPQ